MTKLTTAEQNIIKALSNSKRGLTAKELTQLLNAPEGTVSGRLTTLVRLGVVERTGNTGNSKYKLPEESRRPREMVETRTESHDIPGYMRSQTPRNVTMYSITRLADVMQMKLRNGVKQMTVPLIGESIRIHIGNEVQSWPFSEAFTGYTEIEFRFSNGKSSIIAVASDDVITVALEPKSEGGKNA